MIGILRDEFKQSMALSGLFCSINVHKFSCCGYHEHSPFFAGCRNLSDISQELIVKETVLNSKL